MKVCVFCSSSDNLAPSLYESARQFGRALASHGHSLVYGGYNKGIMGAVADGISAGHGEIISVVPAIFDRPDFTFADSTEVIYTQDLRERKEIMEEKSDAFAILPGGHGTMDELFEMIALKSLGECNKPILILNESGFYDDLQKFMQRIETEGFNPRGNKDLYYFCNTIDELMEKL